jgi:hypothetical protein
MNAMGRNSLRALLFRAALFAAAASLAGYIPYKYTTQLHAISGLYAFLFPLSSLLAVAGIVFAVKPQKACDCGPATRGGIGALSILWLATGVMCAGMLTEAVIENPLHGSIATFHMIAQHVFLSASILAFAVAPDWMATRLAVPAAKPASPGISNRSVRSAN